MSLPNIAILGATGVVGREILKVIEEVNLPYNEIKMLASTRSAGTQIEFKGEMFTVEEATPEAFVGLNIVLASAGASTSKALAPEIVRRGCVLIDNSSAFRMNEDVPLVIVGVNDNDLKKHKGIIANPNCSTSQLMLVLKPLHTHAIMKRLIVSTYQSVSGAGIAAINELTENTKAVLRGKEFENKVFKKPIAFNVIPQIDSFCENGYTKEEMKVTNETRKILHLEDDFPISCTAARVPVYRGHSEAVTIEFKQHMSAELVRTILQHAYGVMLVDNPDKFEYPTAIDVTGRNPVYVGRIREDLAFQNGVSLWCVADNLLIGAALNTVRIAEKVISMKLF
ncbi:MAG: aspartate-semialdehyde dehydrogenase [Candidatus Gastranaerophilales bacterium]|nr:aspartate-semialdehyde dehydrogenase [Candidatus Gastranaerophilales bacterium]